MGFWICVTLAVFKLLQIGTARTLKPKVNLHDEAASHLTPIGQGPPHPPIGIPHDAIFYPSYSYQYGVADEFSEDMKAAYETRDGPFVHGGYKFIQPDGILRVVTYTSDPWNGFQTNVQMLNGLSRHPAPVPLHDPYLHPAPVPLHGPHLHPAPVPLHRPYLPAAPHVYHEPPHHPHVENHPIVLKTPHDLHPPLHSHQEQIYPHHPIAVSSNQAQYFKQPHGSTVRQKHESETDSINLDQEKNVVLPKQSRIPKLSNLSNRFPIEESGKIDELDETAATIPKHKVLGMRSSNYPVAEDKSNEQSLVIPNLQFLDQNPQDVQPQQKYGTLLDKAASKLILSHPTLPIVPLRNGSRIGLHQKTNLNVASNTAFRPFPNQQPITMFLGQNAHQIYPNEDALGIYHNVHNSGILNNRHVFF